MENSSPRRNLQPLLDNETSAPATTAAGNGYAPPGTQRPEQAPPHQGGSGGTATESHDLNLTVTDADGTILNPHGAEDAHLPQLPPLISYCSYVKYACAFGKWLLLVGIANAVGIIIVVAGGYLGWEGYLPFDTWKGGLLALIWVVTSAWCYMAAKVVERDVERYDQMSQYEQGSLTEHQEPNAASSSSSFGPVFVPNYDAIYGQVSRKLDKLLSTKRISPTSQPQQQQEPPPSGTSCLVNSSYALWALFLGFGILLGTGNLLGKHYTKTCNQALPDDTTNSTTDGKFKGDFSKISNFPQGVKDWITESRDPWRYSNTLYSVDDYYTDDYYTPPTYEGDFPLASENDVGVLCEMKDGTLFFAGKAPPKEDDSQKKKNRLVLVESSMTSSATYHEDIINPRMFIPVASTFDTEDNTASAYCFSASDDSKSNDRQRSWDNVIRTSLIYCITTNEDGSFDFKKKTVAWTDKSHRGPKLSAASSGSQILIAHTGNADQYTYQEVLTVDPFGEELSTEVVYHLTQDQGGYDSYGGGRGHENTKCVQEHVLPISIIVAVVVLVASSMWLLLREGIPSGVVPFVYAIVMLIYGINVGLRNGRGYYGYGDRWLMLIMCLGTLLFHIIICCGDGRMCNLPTWIGRDMYVCALYAWLTSFMLFDILASGDMVSVSAMIFFAVTGLILDHPTVKLMGWVSILVGVILIVVWPFFGYGMFDVIPGLLSITLGAGMISVQNCFSNNRVYVSVFCRPMSRAFNSMLYGRNLAAPGTSGSVGGPVPVSV